LGAAMIELILCMGFLYGWLGGCAHHRIHHVRACSVLSIRHA
jgi:hypothetical protein